MGECEQIKIKTDYDRTYYITAGKLYEVEDHNTINNIDYGWIRDNKGEKALVCIGDACAHLGNEGRLEVVDGDE